MEALEMAEAFREEVEQYQIGMELFNQADKKDKAKVGRPEKPRPSPLMNNKNIFEYILLHICKIRGSELENALRFLNFKQCSQLVFYLEYYIRNVRINIFSHHL